MLHDCYKWNTWPWMNIEFFLSNMKPNHVMYLSFEGCVINLTLKETVAVWPQDKDGQYVTATFFLIYGALTQILPSSLGDIICSCNQLERAGNYIKYHKLHSSLTQSGCQSFSPFNDQTAIEDIQSFLTWTLNTFLTVFLQCCLIACITKDII